MLTSEYWQNLEMEEEGQQENFKCVSFKAQRPEFLLIWSPTTSPRLKMYQRGPKSPPPQWIILSELQNCYCPRFLVRCNSFFAEGFCLRSTLGRMCQYSASTSASWCNFYETPYMEDRICTLNNLWQTFCRIHYYYGWQCWASNTRRCPTISFCSIRWA